MKHRILVPACVFGVAFLNDEVYSAFSHRNDLPFTSRARILTTKGSRNPAGTIAGIRSLARARYARVVLIVVNSERKFSSRRCVSYASARNIAHSRET